MDPINETWILEVWDTGRGMNPAMIQEILQPFGQTHGSDAIHGWGLGLAICQGILEAHRGEMRIDSELGKGSQFQMVLPLNPATP